MPRKTKWVLISLSLMAIVVSWAVPSVVLAIHDTHAYSMLVEFQFRDMIDEAAVEEWRKRPGEEDYSVLKRMQQIGGLRSHLPAMSCILTAIFAVNIICIAVVPRVKAGPED